MSVYHIPSLEKKKWTQPNLGDFLGVLWSTFNIDLETKSGKVTVPNRTQVLYSDADDADFDKPTAVLRTKADATDRWWILSNDVLFKSTSATNYAFAQDAITDTPTNLSHLYSDLVEFEGAMIASRAVNLERLVSGTWVNSWWTGAGQLNQAALSTAPHPLHVFNRVLLVADGNILHVIDRNNNVANTRITLPTYYEIRCIRSSPGKIWMGLRHKYGGNAGIAEWNGFSESYSRIHELEGVVVYAIGVKYGIPYAITNAGILYKYDGYGYQTENRLPVFKEKIWQDYTIRTTAEWKDAITNKYAVHWNGMEVIDDKIHILINASISGSPVQLLDNMRSGIWCNDSDLGLYHRFALTKFKNGVTEQDFGTSVINRAGFLKRIPKSEGTFMCGAVINVGVGESEKNAIFRNELGESANKVGAIITTQIHASSIQETWNKLWAKIKKFRDTNASLSIKIRSADDENVDLPFLGSATWTNNTTFTSTDTDFAVAAVGNEVEVLTGDGAGRTAHIKSIVKVSTTYTVVLDESMGSITATSGSLVRVQNWRKIGAFTSITKEYEEFAANEDSTWVQLKVELRGTKDDPELQELIINTQENITSDQ